MTVCETASLALPFLTLSAQPAIGSVLFDSRPAWVWNGEGNRILWSNAAGLAFFAEESMEGLLSRNFGDVHPARRHIARLVSNARTDTPTLDRLRIFIDREIVTLEVLCKKLMVAGEAVLLVLATSRVVEQTVEPLGGETEQSPALIGSLLSSLGANDDLNAILLTKRGEVLASAGENLVTEISELSVLLPDLLAEANELGRVARGAIDIKSKSIEVAVAKIEDNEDARFLLLTQNPDKIVPFVPDPSSNPFAELEEDNQDELERDMKAADIFEDSFHLSEPDENQTDLNERQDSKDLEPFVSEQTEPSFALASQPEQGNVVNLQVGKTPAGSDEHGIEQDDYVGKTLHESYQFTWESDEVGRFIHVSAELAHAVGPKYADLLGKNWLAVAAKLGLDKDGQIARAFEGRETWASLKVWWPVEAGEHRISIELTGLPIFGRLHGFNGFRGFGIAYPDERLCDYERGEHLDSLEVKQPPISGEKSHKHGVFDKEPAELSNLHDNQDLLSDTLMQAADEAVATAAELVSCSTPEDRKPTVDFPSEQAMSAGSREGEAEGTSVSDSNESIERTEDAAMSAFRDRYHLVASLLSGSSLGIRERMPKQTASDTTAVMSPPQQNDPAEEYKLSEGEQHAFDEIATALSHIPIETEEAMGAEETPPLSAQISDALRGQSSLSRTALNKRLETMHKPDERVRSAAGKALMDIFLIDPGLRQVHERLLSNAGKIDLEKEESVGPAKPHKDEAAQEAETLAISDAAPVIAEAATTEESAPRRVHFEIRSDEPRDIEPDIGFHPVASDESVQSIQSREQDDDLAAASAESQTALVAATLVGVAAQEQTDLWDQNQTGSPLIDLLHKLPTAVIVSAKGEIRFASRTALRLLGFGSSKALQDTGGMEGLFTGRPGDWLTKTDGRTTLRSADNSPISVLANISSINWGPLPAAMLCFEEVQATAPSVGVSEEDEKIAELEAILDTATDGVVVLDVCGNILRMNHSAEALFEVDRHEIAGEAFTKLLAEESHKDALEALDKLKRDGIAGMLASGQEIIGRIQSGGLIPLNMTLGRVSIPGTNRFCAVLRDVTDWKRVKEELLTEKLRAEEASKHKSEFLAKVSHEIRTPLNAIIGFSEVMMQERFGAIGPSRYKDYLKDIKLSSNHIMTLLNDLLDLSKVEAGKMDLQFEAIALNRLVAECVGITQAQANRAQIIIRSSLSSHVPDIVGDSRSLRQIILNLLSNAVKFTSAGGQVIVSSTQTEQGDVILRIRDTGIGMSDEEVARALEPFRQMTASTRSLLEGTGLGLPLTKALAEANRARFKLSSQKGQGTLVEIAFPGERVVARQIKEQEAQPTV